MPFLEPLLDTYWTAPVLLSDVTVRTVTVVAALRELSLHYNWPFAR